MKNRFSQTGSQGPKRLNLEDLRSGFRPGLTPTMGGFMAEAAAVCLKSQGHSGTAILSVTGEFAGEYVLRFGAVTQQMRSSHNDNEVATEYGAYGVSILLFDANSELTVVERSRKGTGFDYWLGQGDSHGQYFQKTARLEVSGIRSGTVGQIEGRLRMKLHQTERSDGMLPAYVSVIEFGYPRGKVVKKWPL